MAPRSYLAGSTRSTTMLQSVTSAAMAPTAASQGASRVRHDVRLALREGAQTGRLAPFKAAAAGDQAGGRMDGPVNVRTIGPYRSQSEAVILEEIHERSCTGSGA